VLHRSAPQYHFQARLKLLLLNPDAAYFLRCASPFHSVCLPQIMSYSSGPSAPKPRFPCHGIIIKEGAKLLKKNEHDEPSTIDDVVLNVNDPVMVHIRDR
jgi:hypothetical protein